MTLNPLTAISPIDGRYHAKTKKLAAYFSEFGLIRYRVQIEVEYFITRRKVYEGGDFPQKRIQEFRPAAGKIKINKSTQLLEEFLS